MTEERQKTPQERLEIIERTLDIQPQTFKIYKGITGKWGALQLSMVPIERSRRDLGALFVAAANPTSGPEKTYDWQNKIVMSLNLADIANLLEFITYQKPNKDGKPMVSIYHDPNAGSHDARKESKVLDLARGKNDGWFVKVGHKTAAGIKEVSLPISDGECLIIKTLLERATVRMLGW